MIGREEGVDFEGGFEVGVEEVPVVGLRVEHVGGVVFAFVAHFLTGVDVIAFRRHQKLAVLTSQGRRLGEEGSM